jgi:hypothetical protein
MGWQIPASIPSLRTNFQMMYTLEGSFSLRNLRFWERKFREWKFRERWFT